MDETSVKAGRVAPGKMRTAYFWPVYGEADGFHYAPSRAHVFLGDFKGTMRRLRPAAGHCCATRSHVAFAKESESADYADFNGARC